MNAANLLDSVLDPFAECLTPGSARKIVDFHPGDDVQRRLDELSEKSRRGLLNDEEREEYHQYVETFDLIALLKSKARSVLSR